MVVTLVGYPGSQKIVKASKYLTNKYLPDYMQTSYINYKGDINKWAAYLSGWLDCLTTEYIVFALDDYLLAAAPDEKKLNQAMSEIGGDVVCIKLCHSTEQEHEEYPVTTQYTLWSREYLIELLSKVNTPWEFEIKGSRLFDKKVLHRPCLDYFTNSSISARWEGVRLDGLNEKDIKFIKENNLIMENKSGLHITGTLKPNEKYDGFI